MTRLFWIFIFTFIFILIDVYAFQAVKTSAQNLSSAGRKAVYITYWSISALAYGGIVLFMIIGFQNVSNHFRNFFISSVFGLFLTKLLIAIFLLIDDLMRLGKWITQLFLNNKTGADTQPDLSRSEFLAKAGLAVATIPLITMTHGIVKGAYDYRIHRQKVRLKNLPSSFHGLKIAQLSDIHSGSFFNKKAVMGGVQMLLDEKPDLVFFTGDLVNHEASELKDYADIFARVKAPLGVYSVLGNHDYGDYVQWPSREAKIQNLKSLMETQKRMGWQLLINENRILQQGGESLAIIGVENWGGRGNFPKYGKLNEAYRGTEDVPVKLLLSHDPSHWRAQVLDYDIDITFSGHTHGFQFGIENEFIRWSPVKYFYKEWAGLYSENEKHLYVNRGFGFIGFPGRIGILPEITIFELEKA